MKPLASLTAVAAAFALAAGCATVPQPRQPQAPLPYRIAVKTRIQVPDPFPVLAGPGETYVHLRVGGDVSGALARWARVRGTRTARQALAVRVSVLDLEAGYDQIGAERRAPPVRLASLGMPGPLALDQSNLAIPEEIRKTLRLTAEIEAAPEGRQPVVRRETVEVTHVVRWEDYDRWAYDYGPVWKEVLAGLVARVDRIAAEATRP